MNGRPTDGGMRSARVPHLAGRLAAPAAHARAGGLPRRAVFLDHAIGSRLRHSRGEMRFSQIFAAFNLFGGTPKSARGTRALRALARRQTSTQRSYAGPRPLPGGTEESSFAESGITEAIKARLRLSNRGSDWKGRWAAPARWRQWSWRDAPRGSAAGVRAHPGRRRARRS